MLERPTGPTSQVPGTWSCPDPHFAKLYPSLAEGLCETTWADGKARKPWKISIGFDDKSCSVCINCKNTNSYSYTNARDLSEALRLVNEAVAANTLTWRKNTR